MRKLFLYILSIFVFTSAFSQRPGNRGTGDSRFKNNGRFYGKIIDASTNKAIEFAPIQVFQVQWDTIIKAPKNVFVGGQLTEGNGDFSIENVPLMGQFVLKISPIGYENFEKKVVFEPGSSLDVPERDLGNIKIKLATQQLKEVVVDGSEPSYKLEIDKKVYNVDKNPVNAGGTGEDVLKNVPSVNVDMDGNVTMRNASPQIFVDGRPTTLTIDQIPADAIESIEVITNPSAKYDASGGGGGIINIVLKKNRKIGYNGSVRAGIDMRGKINTNVDLNAREKKINIFASANYNQRRNIGTGITERYNLGVLPQNNVFQNTKSQTDGYFMSGKGGLDYFIDNRNTITLSQSYHKSFFDPVDNINRQTDTVYPYGTISSFSKRISDTQRQNANSVSSLLYKKLFTKAGKELTADMSYSRNRNKNEGNFTTVNHDENNTPIGFESIQKQKGSGSNDVFTAQTDLVNPLNDKMKVEAGARAMLRSYSSINENFLYNYSTAAYEKLNYASSNYKFNDRVYAAYATFSSMFKKIGYQVGLRAESSNYIGKLIETGGSFQNTYPLSLFPSAFVSYKMNDQNDFQVNYSRRVNRPSFMQLIPFVDYSDSLNLSRGNPALKPQFTNSMEFSYQKIFNRSNNFLVSVYYKNTVNIVTRYQVLEYDTVLNKDVIINTYQNANSSYSYGLELTSKNALKTWLDATTNVNLYNSIIDGGNIQNNLRNERFSWFVKLNLSFKLPKDFSVQLTGDYLSKSAMPVNGGGDSRGGGSSWFGPPPSTLQGYINPNYGLDIAVKKEFLKNKNATVTLSVSDVFKTRQNSSYSESPYFIQNTLRKRDQQLFKINFSYRFGKFDTSLFRRKNSKSSMDGMDNGI